MAETEDHASHSVSRSMANNAGPSFIESKLSGSYPHASAALAPFLFL
jgi:hypothetical protein